MGRILLFTLLAALAGGLLAVSGTAGSTEVGVPAPAAFRLGDGSAGCAFDGERLACRGASSEAAAVLERDGRSRPEDVDVTWDASTPVLRKTERWFNGTFSCAVEGRNVVCSNAAGGALSAGAGWVGGAPPAAAEP